MGIIGEDQVQIVKEYLDKGGIQFEPLRSELLDHLLSDIEDQMTEGVSFDEVWERIKLEIPNHHLQNLEKESMELLSQNNRLSNILGSIALGILAVGSLLKLFHLQGANEMLLTFFVFTAFVIVFTTIKNIIVYKEKKGRFIIVFVGLTFIAFLGFMGFRMLHLPGANELRIFSILSMSIIFPFISLYFFLSKEKLKDHLIIHIISSSRSFLTKIIVMTMLIGFIFNYSALLMGEETFIGNLFFIFTMIMTGLFIFTLSWEHFVNQYKTISSNDNLSLYIASVAAFEMFLLPAMGIEVSYLVYVAYLILGLIILRHYLIYSKSDRKRLITYLIIFYLAYPLLRWMIHEGFAGEILSSLTDNAAFNFGFLAVALITLGAFRKERLFSYFMILIVALHMVPVL